MSNLTKFIDNTIIPQKKFCIFSYVDRYNLFVDLWIKHHSKFNLDMYLFTNEKENNNLNLKIKELNPKINVIDIKDHIDGNHGGIIHPDCGSYDYMINIEFYNKVQEKLLNFYNKIIHIDIDELILSPDLTKILNLNKDVIVSKGFELIHNFNLEKKYDINKKILEQRNFGLFNITYNKSSIISKKFNWTNGKHNRTIAPDEDLYLMSLGRIDINLMFENSNKNKIFYQKPRWHHQFDNINDVENNIKKYYINNIKEIPKEIKECFDL
jgi:hypothetical protein